MSSTNALRVIIVEGDPKSPRQSVKRRHLDPVPWHILAGDESARTWTLRRGPTAVGTIDQFKLRESSGVSRHEVVATVFARSPLVRQTVLARAEGRCEYCNQYGFVRPDGLLYLETHHIQPLSEGGSDDPRNVIALCANHHREAHFGAAVAVLRSEIESRLA